MRGLPLPCHSLLLVFGLALVPSTAFAQTTHLVTTEAQLRTAIAAGAVGDTIRLQNSIVLTADLPTIARTLSFDGGGFTLSGADQFRGLALVQTGGGTAPPVNVDIRDLTIAHTVASGGAGGGGIAGGGGGAGVGGAIFVGSFANVTLSNVAVISSSAAGGDGGSAIGGTGYGGGGGMGGAGGSAAGGFSGGGGGFGTFAAGGTNTGGHPAS